MDPYSQPDTPSNPSNLSGNPGGSGRNKALASYFAGLVKKPTQTAPSVHNTPSEPEVSRTEEKTEQPGELIALVRKQHADLSKTVETCAEVFGARDAKLAELERKNTELHNEVNERNLEVLQLRGELSQAKDASRAEEERSGQLGLKRLLAEKDDFIKSMEKLLEDARTPQLPEEIRAMLREADPTIDHRSDLLIKKVALRISSNALEDARKVQNIRLQTLKSLEQETQKILGVRQALPTPFGPNPKDNPGQSGMLGATAGDEPSEGQGGMNCRESRIQPWKGTAPVASKALPPIEFDTAIRRRVSLEAKDRAIQEINSPDKQSPNPELQHSERTQRLDKLRCGFAAMESRPSRSG